MEPLQSTLMAHLRQVPDFRNARGQRFAWTYLLALVAAAVAAGQTTLLTMTDWADQHAAELIATLQPACPRMPSVATWRRLVAHIDINSLEQHVAAYNQALDSADPTVGSVTMCDGQFFRGQAVDGKDVRGARAHGERTFLVSLVRHEQRLCLGPGSRGRENQRNHGCTVAADGPRPDRHRDDHGCVADATPIARQILAQGGHYLMVVKSNQPSLYEAIALLFRTPPVPARPGEHGRPNRRQRPWPLGTASAVKFDRLNGLPGLARRRTGPAPHLSPAQSTHRPAGNRNDLWHHQPAAGVGRAKQLEQFWRGHWTIENCLHYVRDETLGEDRCQVHSGHAPQALAAFRNAILSLLRFHGWSNIAAATRRYAEEPQRFLRLFGVPAQ